MTARIRLTFVAAVATLLAALALESVFQDGAWVWPVVAAVGCAAGGGALGRRAGVPRPLVALVSLAALLLLATVLYANADAVWGFLPGPGAVRDLHALLVTAFDDVRRFASPAPTEPGLVLLAVLGVGCAAVAVDTLAVTYRSAALAGGPLLALYAVPAGVARGGISWVLFALAAVGWLALLLAEGRERLSGWGRALGRRSSKGDGIFTGAPAEPLGVLGRRIGAAALGMAVILPAVVPVVSGDLFAGSTAGGSGGPGIGTSGSITTINPLVSIAAELTDRNDTTVLTYSSSDPNPDYLRMVTLDTFDGTTWNVATLRPAGRSFNLDPSEAAAMPGRQVSTQLTLTNLRSTWLPVPYPASKVSNLTGSWAFDQATLDIFADGNDTTQGRTYDVSSVHPSLTAAELRAAGSAGDAAIIARYTALPAGLPPVVEQTTRSVVKNLTSDYAKAEAIERFFLDPVNGFAYTTDLPAYTGSPLVAFLTDRKGFCQQFATMFAVMARQAGLPTRIDVGFTQGYQKTPGTGVWTVGRQNAHAWPEVYFQGIGWVRFEPTPGPSGVQTPSWAPGPTSSRLVGGTSSGQVSQGEHNGQRDLQGNDAAASVPRPALAAARSTGVRGWQLGAAAALVVIVLVLPALARLLRRRRRFGHRGEMSVRVMAAWAELGDTGRDIGVPWASSGTPRRIAESLVAYGVRGEAADAARRLARAVERVRYAPGGVAGADVVDPGADARRVAKAMEASTGRRLRWRARLAPSSVLAVAGGRFADLLDWVDGLGARTRVALGRMLPSRLVRRET